MAICKSLYSPGLGMAVYSRSPSLRQPGEKEVDYTFHGDILEDGKAVMNGNPLLGVVDIQEFQCDIGKFIEFVEGLDGALGNESRMRFEEFLQNATGP